MLVMRGKQLSDWLKKHFIAGRTEGDPRYSVAGPAHSSGNGSANAPSGTGSSAGQQPSQRRRRRRRRNSIVGLPIYTEDPAEAEMTLFKHRPSMDSRSSVFNASASQIDLLYYDQVEVTPSESSLSLALARTRTGGTTTQTNGIDIEGGNLSLPDSPALGMRSRSSTVNSTGYSSVPSLHPPLYGNGGDITCIPSAGGSRPTSALSASRPRHISTHSSPLNIPSSSSLTTTSTSAGARPTQGRNRASTFRSIFTRDGAEGSMAVRVGGGSGRVGVSPYGQSGAAGARSSSSVAGLSISAPLQHTLVSSSFIFPRAGISPSQIAFISSRESLGAFGYGPGESPPAFPFDPPSPFSPTFPALNGGSGPGEDSLGVGGRWGIGGAREEGLVEGRGRRSSSVSNSPLRFVAHFEIDITTTSIPSPQPMTTTTTNEATGSTTTTHLSIDQFPNTSSSLLHSSSSSSAIISTLPELEELSIDTERMAEEVEVEIPEVYIDTPSAVENEVQGSYFARSITV